MAERAVARAKGFGEISKILSVAIYIARPCRCDRVEQLGGTEMHNCVQLQQIGETEKLKSVAQRFKTQINLMISVGPKWKDRSDRELLRGFGSLSL